MPIARIDTGSEILSGEYEDGTIEDERTSYSIEDEGIDLLPPCEPESVYCVGRNYSDYVTENADLIDENLSHGAELPPEVHFFLKSASNVIASGEPIPYPTFSDSVGYGGELTAVIGERCHHVEPETVPDVIQGYTIMNDLTAKDQPGITKTKVFDGSAPLGPAIADVDPFELRMQTKINGERRQEAVTSAMHYGPYEAVSEISKRVTLHPGDVVALGSPANPGTIEPGDTIEIWYEGIGTLTNSVARS